MIAILLAVVYVTEIYPFVYPNADGELTGFDIDVTRRVYSELGVTDVTYELRNNITDVLNAVEATIDHSVLTMGAASITINSAREEHVDFSPAYFSSGLQVMTRKTGDFNTVAGRIVRNFFTALGLFFAGMLVLVSVLAPVAYALEFWFTPKGSVPLFWRPDDGNTRQERMVWGMLRSTLWTLFTVFGTQTGYPTSIPGRAIHATLKAIAVLLVIVATAMFTSVFIVSTHSTDIGGYDDLSGKTVCTVEGTTSFTFIRNNPRGFQTIASPTADDMFDSFWSKRCQAAIYDFPVMQAEILRRVSNGETDDVTLVGPVFQSESYGFPMPQDMVRREEVRQAVLRTVEDESFMNSIYTKYLNSERGSSISSPGDMDVPTAWIVVPCVLGFGVSLIVAALLWRNFDDRQPEFHVTLKDLHDDDYGNDEEDLRTREIFNDDYLYGADWSTEQSLKFSMRSTRVVYQIFTMFTRVLSSFSKDNNTSHNLSAAIVDVLPEHMRPHQNIVLEEVIVDRVDSVSEGSHRVCGLEV